MSAAELGALAAMAAAVAGPMVSVFIWWSSRVESKIDALGRDVSDVKQSMATVTADVAWLKSHSDE
jgi:hypothetical protein